MKVIVLVKACQAAEAGVMPTIQPKSLPNKGRVLYEGGIGLELMISP